MKPPVRELTLVRHAHAERQSHDGEDFERAVVDVKLAT